MKSKLYLFSIIFLFLAIHQTPTNAQTNQDKCVRKCARDAKAEIRDCRKLSKQCIKDNIDDILTVFDYCTDSFVGSCESVVNGNYRSCIMDICGIDFVDFRTFTEFDPVTASACSTNGADIVNPVLAEMEKITNDGWQVAACKFGLCPLTPVFNGSIHIGCSPNTGLAVLLNTDCQAILPFSGCENFWADVDITSLEGLQYIEYENFMVTQITGATGT